MSKFLDKTGLDTFWAKIKSTFQTLGNLVTSIRDASSASDDKYPSEKAVATAISSVDGNKMNTNGSNATSTAGGNIIRAMGDWNNPADGELIAAAGASTGQGKYTLLKLWNFFKGKFDSTLSESSTSALQTKEITRWVNLAIGDDGYFSGSAANPQLSVEKAVVGGLSLRNEDVKIKIYTFDEDDEENATLVWDIDTASDDIKSKFKKAQQLGTIYQSEAGKCVKIWCDTYSSAGCYFRALAIFMDTKDTSSSVSTFYGHLRTLGTTPVDYPEYQFQTWGSSPTVTYSKSSVGQVEIVLRPKTSNAKCRIYGFRCLNTNTNEEKAVLLGSANKLTTARKLKTNLARTADSTFDGSANQENIPVTGTLPLGNGGTGKTTAKAAEYNLTTGKSEISDNTSGDDRVVFELASPSETNGVTRGFRKLSTIWAWIKGLLSSESGVNISGNAATATKATQDSDGNAINATYFKSSGNTTLVAGAATKIGTQNGADVKLTLPSIPAAQVNSDWNASSGVAEILNKPTLGTAAAKDVPASGNASTTQVVMGNDSRLTDSRTPTSHTHGNITNAGGITASGVTIANGDSLVIVDSSETNKLVAKTSVTFDGSTTTKALTQKGTFETFMTPTDISGKMNASADNATAPSSSGGDGASATLLNNLTSGGSDIVTSSNGDNVLIPTTDNGGTVINKWYKRPLVKFWPWIKAKIMSGRVGSENTDGYVGGYSYGDYVNTSSGIYGWKIGYGSTPSGWNQVNFKALVVICDWSNTVDNDGVGGSNFTGILDISIRMNNGTASASNWKVSARLVSVVPNRISSSTTGWCVVATKNSSTYRADFYIKRYTGNAQMRDSNICYTTITITPLFEKGWNRVMERRTSMLDTDTYFQAYYPPTFTTANGQGAIGSSRYPVYMNSNKQIVACEKIVKGYQLGRGTGSFAGGEGTKDIPISIPSGFGMSVNTPVNANLILWVDGRSLTDTVSLTMRLQATSHSGIDIISDHTIQVLKDWQGYVTIPFAGGTLHEMPDDGSAAFTIKVNFGNTSHTKFWTYSYDIQVVIQ